MRHRSFISDITKLKCFRSGQRLKVRRTCGEFVELILQRGRGVEGSKHFGRQSRHGLVQGFVEVDRLNDRMKPSRSCDSHDKHTQQH